MSTNRRPAGPGLILGAVLATAALAAGGTYLIVRSSDAGQAGTPVAAVSPSAASASPTAPGVGTTTPNATTTPTNGQPVARPWLGIHVVTIDPAIAQANNLPVDKGAWITASTAPSSGDSSGGSSAGQDPNAESSPGTDSDGEGSPGTDPNAQASPGTDADGEGQVPGSQAPAGGVGPSGTAVIPGSPAAQAGLQDGDIITAVDATALDATHPLDRVMSHYAPGTTVALDVLRNGQHATVSVTLGTRPANG